MKKLIILLLIAASSQAVAQDLTTFILVRHAEKQVDGTKDPALTKEGEQRANNLLALLERDKITAIYSTNYQRTLLTVAPLAMKLGIAIQKYDWKDPKGLLEKILSNHRGGSIVISGHSNTTPVLANLLLGEEAFAQFQDDDYGNLLIITTAKLGQGKLTHLRY